MSESLPIALMIFIAVACAVAWRPAWDDGIQTKAPARIEELHPAIVYTSHEGGLFEPLEIVLDREPSFDDATVVYDFADDALSVAKGLKQYFPDLLASTVRFTVLQPEVIGEPTTEARTISLHLAAAALKAIDVEGETSVHDLLNLTLAVSYGELGGGKDLVHAFCATSYARSAARFCQREAA